MQLYVANAVVVGAETFEWRAAFVLFPSGLHHHPCHLAESPPIDSKPLAVLADIFPLNSSYVLLFFIYAIGTQGLWHVASLCLLRLILIESWLALIPESGRVRRSSILVNVAHLIGLQRPSA
jgi:hypothetical protein